jgi:hypothetical protein
MEIRQHVRNGTTIGEVCGEGLLLGKSADIGVLLGAAFRVDALALHVEDIAPEVFDLRTGILGEFFQKLVNYRRRLVIVGDVSQHEARSEAFAALVRESNRGRDVAFVRMLDDFAG